VKVLAKAHKSLSLQAYLSDLCAFACNRNKHLGFISKGVACGPGYPLILLQALAARLVSAIIP